MNERIKQLERQATETVKCGLNGTSTAESFNRKKFAELIVAECIEQASIGNGHGNNQWDRALTFAAKNIKQHFGVEE